jgi:hypothetical protein
MHDDLTLARSRGAVSTPASGVWLAALLLPAVFPLLIAAIGLGLWLDVTSLAAISAPARIVTWLMIMVPLALWLVAVRALARTRAYAHPLAIPLGVLVPPVIGIVLLTRLPLLRELMSVTPPAWLIGSMVVRVVGGISLIAAASGEVRRPLFNSSCGALDILIGITALPVAVWRSSGSPLALSVAIGWNALGLFDFALAMVLARFGSGPRDMLLLNTHTVGTLKRTVTGIVTFAVPLAIVIHILSIWQLVTG